MIKNRKYILDHTIITKGSVNVETGECDIHVPGIDWVDTFIDAMTDEPRLKGTWEWKTYYSNKDGVLRKETGCRCSNCKRPVPTNLPRFRYCPYCGSDNKDREVKGYGKSN